MKHTLKQLLLFLTISSFSTALFAQCFPTDRDCQEAPSQKVESLFDLSLQTPPTLEVEETQEVWASDFLQTPDASAQPYQLGTWGAVAKDFDLAGLKGLGISSHQPSQEDAALAAIAHCQVNGGLNCTIDWLYNQSCMGIAQNDGGDAFWAEGKNQNLATEAVMQKCGEAGPLLCHLVHVECSGVNTQP